MLVMVKREKARAEQADEQAGKRAGGQVRTLEVFTGSKYFWAINLDDVQRRRIPTSIGYHNYMCAGRGWSKHFRRDRNT